MTILRATNCEGGQWPAFERGLVCKTMRFWHRQANHRLAFFTPSRALLVVFKPLIAGVLSKLYNGVLMILRHFISKDPYTENHSYRVSVYASRIAEALRFSSQRIEDVRAAALLHDIGKLEVSREVLYKAFRLTEVETAEIRAHVNRGVAILEPIGGSLRRVEAFLSVFRRGEMEVPFVVV
jgi:putative nucleotidyltransferase with HDIG domain